MLKTVVIASSVTKIGNRAFSNCGELANVTMLGERPEAPNNIFQNCGKLKSIHVPANAKSWAGMKKWQGIPLVFDGAADVDGYTWSYRVVDGEAMIVAEKGGRFLCAVSPMPTGDVKIPATLGGVQVTSIGRDAFYNCNGLKSVVIPTSVKRIEMGGFSGCSGLTSVTIPDGMAHIGFDAFSRCRGLTTVSIPSGVEIDRRAFTYCNALKQINVDARNPKYTSVDGVLYTKDMTELVEAPGGVKSVNIPENIKRLGDGSFKGCSTLTSITIPSGVTYILPWTFEDCTGLESVKILGNVTHIGSQAFWKCRELTTLTMCGERPEAPNNIFQGCGKLKAIHVPANAKSWAGMKEWQGIPLVFDAK